MSDEQKPTVKMNLEESKAQLSDFRPKKGDEGKKSLADLDLMKPKTPPPPPPKEGKGE